MNIDISQKELSVYRSMKIMIKKTSWPKCDTNFVSQFKFNNCDLHEGNQTCIYGETPFRCSRWTNCRNDFPENLDNQDFDAGIDIRGFSNDSSSTGKRFPIEIFLEEFKPVNKEKFESGNRKKKQNFFKKIDSWECPDFDSKNQLTENVIESFFPSLRLLIVTLMEGIKPVVTEKHYFDN